MSGNAADVAQFAWMAAIEARLDALWAWVVAIAAFVWGVMVVVANTFIAWATPIIVWLQGIVAWLISIYQTWILPVVTWLQSMYTTYVLPVLTWLQAMVFWLQTAMLLVQGKVEQLITFVYDKIFKDVEELRANIIKVFDVIKDVASVFSRDLADKIQATEDKFLRVLDSYTRDLRDWAISSLHEATDPLIRKTNEISILLNGFINVVQDRFKPIENLIAITFEKPQTLKREVLFTTSMHWGAGLWNDLFSGVTPKEPITPSEEMVRLQVDPVVDKYIQDIFAEKVEGWQDMTQRVDEEIREKFYGEVVPRKTEIKTVKLGAGAGGGF